MVSATVHDFLYTTVMPGAALWAFSDMKVFFATWKTRQSLVLVSMWSLCSPRTNNYSRSYAEDVTLVTSGASQGPHSFNLVFVCVFVCLCHAWRYLVSIPYCTVPAKTAGHNIFVCLCHRHAWRYPVPVPYHREYGTIKRMSIYAKCMGGMHSVQ